MLSSNVKRKLKEKQPVLSAKVNFKSPQIVEMMGLIGFDCLWLCNEHIYIDNQELDHLVLAARASGMDVLLRRNISGYQDILQPLEMGVHGLMIPRVRDVSYLQRIVEYVKFPPMGKRGVDGVGADADFGLLSLDDYLIKANEETFIVAQIEDLEVIDQIEAIAALDGVDVLFIGHVDLSLSLGIPGQVRHEKILEVMDRVLEACSKHGKTAGIPAIDAEETVKLLEKGFRFFTTGADYRYIKNALLKLKKEFSEIGFRFRTIDERLL